MTFLFARVASAMPSKNPARLPNRIIHFLTATEEGQDLVEYALVVALIAFSAVIGMGKLATEINTAFKTISSDLASSLT
jgi:pilus assembly protein Flp/PilA